MSVMHRGVSLAPVIGEIMADLMTKGRTPHNIEPYLLARFAGVPVEAHGELQEKFYVAG